MKASVLIPMTRPLGGSCCGGVARLYTRQVARRSATRSVRSPGSPWASSVALSRSTSARSSQKMSSASAMAPDSARRRPNSSSSPRSTGITQADVKDTILADERESLRPAQCPAEQPALQALDPAGRGTDGRLPPCYRFLLAFVRIYPLTTDEQLERFYQRQRIVCRQRLGKVEVIDAVPIALQVALEAALKLAPVPVAQLVLRRARAAPPAGPRACPE